MALELVLNSIYFPAILVLFLFGIVFLFLPLFVSKFKLKWCLFISFILILGSVINFFAIYYSFKAFVDSSMIIFDNCRLIDYRRDFTISITDDHNFKIIFECRENGISQRAYLAETFAIFYDINFLEKHIARDCTRDTDDSISCAGNTFIRPE